MKNNILKLLLVLVFTGCASSPYGTKIKEPFSGSTYESNNRFFRATGKGESSSENIARGKADIEAKTYLAGQVNTTMKQVADNYIGQTENERGADVARAIDGVGARLDDVANDDVPEFHGVSTALRDGGLGRVHGKVGRGEALEGAVHGAERGALGGDDDDFLAGEAHGGEDVHPLGRRRKAPRRRDP